MFYIFDYGATIDTPGNHWGKTIWHAYEKAGVKISEQQFRDAYVYAERYLGANPVISETDTFHTTLSIKLKLQLEHLKLFATELHQKLLSDLYNQAKANIERSRRVLNELYQHNNSLGVVSNFYGNIEAVLNEFELRDFFSAVVESATEGIRKPDPRLLALCMERMNANPSETIVIGDHLTKDIQPAKQLGCKAIWIKGEPWSDEHDKLKEVVPDLIISSLDELLD